MVWYVASIMTLTEDWGAHPALALCLCLCLSLPLFVFVHVSVCLSLSSLLEPSFCGSKVLCWRVLRRGPHGMELMSSVDMQLGSEAPAQPCEWVSWEAAILRPVHSHVTWRLPHQSPEMTAAPREHLTAIFWETLSQRHSANPFLHS